MNAFWKASVAFACLGATVALGVRAGNARIVENAIELPVEVTDMNGRVERRPITVTIWHDDARARSPMLVLNHGRAVSEADRAKLGRVRSPGNARYFVSQGFAVLIPTRIGYGVTGGPDVENSGSCRAKNYAPGYEAAARQSVRVIEYAKTLPHIDPAAGLVVGQSFGGMTTIALAAKNIPGISAGINFAGGGGGNPKTRPERPCRNDLLTSLYGTYGKTSRSPTLWLYSENDRFWGKDKPRAWFKAFTGSGGAGQFEQLPAHGENGHGSFGSNPAAWRPEFEEFLRAHRISPGAR